MGKVRLSCRSFWSNPYYILAVSSGVSFIVSVSYGAVAYQRATSRIFTTLFDFVAGKLYLAALILSVVVQGIATLLGPMLDNQYFLACMIFLRIASLIVSHVATYKVFMMKLTAVDEIGVQWSTTRYSPSVQATKTALHCCGWNLTTVDCRFLPKCAHVIRGEIYSLVRELDIALLVIDASQIWLLVLTIMVIVSGVAQKTTSGK